MIIHVNTDKSSSVNETMYHRLKNLLSADLNRLTEDITWLNVHLSDDDANKESFFDKRCMLEARLKGNRPVSVIELADTHEHAVKGAINKLKHSLGSVSGRISNY